MTQPSTNWLPIVLEIVVAIFEFLIFQVKLLYYYAESIHQLFVKIPKSVRGEIVLITGTGHGIGRELALLYAANGATVVGWDINEKTSRETVKEIQKLGYPTSYSYVCDVANRENVMEVAKKVQKDVGNVTILINNAGIMPTRSFLDHTPEVIEKLMGINVMAHFWTIQAFLPAMKQNNYGHIVCLSSMAGQTGIYNLAPYNATKFAVRGLMEGLWEEFRRNPNNRIEVTTICPFMVDTGLCEKPKIRFKNITKLLNPKEVAEEIFNAQVNDVHEVCLPRYQGVLVKFSKLFWPLKAQHTFFDTFETSLESDL